MEYICFLTCTLAANELMNVASESFICSGSELDEFRFLSDGRLPEMHICGLWVKLIPLLHVCT